MKIVILLCMLAAVVLAAPASENLTDTPCTPGEQRMNDCNTCTCVKDGTGFSCTRMACRPKRDTKVPVNTPGFRCTPGESFKDDCNTCRCTPDGRSAACTLIGCIH